MLKLTPLGAAEGASEQETYTMLSVKQLNAAPTLLTILWHLNSSGQCERP